MAVKNHNTYNIGAAGGSQKNQNIGADISMVSNPLNYAMERNSVEGVGTGKYVNDSISDSNMGTNYTKARGSGQYYAQHLAESNDGIFPRTKRNRKLPDINDGSGISPK